MNRKFILGLALALVLVSGAFMNSNAANLNGPYFAKPACWSFACGLPGSHGANAAAPVSTPQLGAVGY